MMKNPRNPKFHFSRLVIIQVDQATMLMLGGIPWQAYFQRVLSARDVSVAKTLSFAASFGCFAAAIPPVVIGELWYILI